MAGLPGPLGNTDPFRPRRPAGRHAAHQGSRRHDQPAYWLRTVPSCGAGVRARQLPFTGLPTGMLVLPAHAAPNQLASAGR